MFQELVKKSSNASKGLSVFDDVSREPVVPPRPVIPAVLFALVTCIFAQQWVLAIGYDEKSFAILMVVSLAVLCCALLPFIPLPDLPVAPIAVAVMAGFISAAAFKATCEQTSVQLMHTPVSALEFEISSDASSFGDRWRSRAHVSGDALTEGNVWVVSSERLSLGDRIHCVGQASALKDDEWGKRDQARGICGTVSIKRIVSLDKPDGMEGMLHLLRRDVLEAIKPEQSGGRALLAGCVCGYRIDLVAKGIEDSLSNSGLVHLVAVSGGHLTTVAALLNIFLEKTRLSGIVRFLIVSISTAMFTAFCGAPASALRAWIMTVSAMTAPLIGRKSHGLSSASVAGLALCLIDPSTSSDMGFQLSALSVAGLYIFSPYATYLLTVLCPCIHSLSILPHALRFRSERLIQSLFTQIAASIVAQLVTMPITVTVFGTIPLIGPLANALLGPAFSWFVSLGCIAVVLLWVPFIGSVLIWVCELFATALLTFAFILSSIPGACMAVGDSGLLCAALALLGLFALLVLWPPVSKRLMRGICVILFATFIAYRCVWGIALGGRLVILDVGQGDAILIQDGNYTVLVDTGPDEAVVQALARNHVTKLDAVIITHLHDDHYGGLDELTGFVQVDHLYVGQGVSNMLPEEVSSALQRMGSPAVSELSSGDTLSVGHFTLEVVSPDGATDGLENQDSLVLLVRYVNSPSSLSALLCGDAETDVTEPLTRDGYIGDIDVLKLGHHGSEASVSEEMLRCLQPELCVASAGKGNRYGHPSPAAMAMVKASGAHGICTIDSGDVSIKPLEDGISVSCAMSYDEAVG